MTFEELAVKYAIALATRPHTSYKDTNKIAIDAAKDLLIRIKEAQEAEQ